MERNLPWGTGRFHEKTSREHPEISQIILGKIKVAWGHVLDL